MSVRILVLGGNSGIGLTTADYLQSCGYEVYVASRRDPDIKKEGITYYNVDVKHDEQVVSLMKNFSHTGLDGVVYSIGITDKNSSIEETNIDRINEIMDVNVNGFLRIIKFGLKILQKKNASIVLVNSIAGRHKSDFSSVGYTMSKHALNGVMNHFASTLALEGIRINSVYPSMTMTTMLTDKVSAEQLEELSSCIPMRRLAHPVDIARGIEFFLNPSNSYLVGSGLDINGGIYLNG